MFSFSNLDKNLVMEHPIKMTEPTPNELSLKKRAKKIIKQKYADLHKKPTHLFMHEKGLMEIPKPKSAGSILFAYFHNNQLTKIQNLEAAYSLTHLHLQWNKITKIEGLDQLTKLKKLFLGNNRITVVENLENLKNLEELRIEKQNLDGVDGLCFDPRSMIALGLSLRILDVSGNKITDMAWVKSLRRLEVLIAKKNNLEDHKAVADELCVLMCLVEVNFLGNPMVKKHRYKETIIARCAQLRVLDDITIQPASKMFMEGLDKAIRLRQMHENNKIEFNNEGLEKFYDLNLIPRPKTKSAVSAETVSDAPTKPKAMAIDSSYAFLPAMYRKPISSPAGQERPHPKPVQFQSSFAKSLIEGPTKGILKKPMPFKYM